MLADAAGQFVATELERTRALPEGAHGHDPAVWKTIAQQGWLSMLVPESRGGLGVGVSAAAALARQFGRGAIREPFVAVGVAAATCLAGSVENPLWNAYLSELMAGHLIASLAWQAPSGAFDPGATTIESAVTGDGTIVLNGTCRLVAAPYGDAFIVSARQRTGAALYWVERDRPGLSLTVERCADNSALAALTFRQVALSGDACLASGDAALSLLGRTLDTALVVNAAELLGLMDAALDMTLDYLRTRRQFGAPIGSFQALQHRAVDIWLQRQLTEAAIEAAVPLMDDPHTTTDTRSAAASAVAARAAQAAAHLMREALQLHGAIGFAEEHGLGRYINRALVLGSWLGNAAQHRRRFGAFTPSAVRAPTSAAEAR